MTVIIIQRQKKKTIWKQLGRFNTNAFLGGDSAKNKKGYTILNLQIHKYHTMEQTNKCMSIKHVLSYITIHQYVSVASATIIRVAYNNTNNIETFIVAPCILIFTKLIHQHIHLYQNFWLKFTLKLDGSKLKPSNFNVNFNKSFNKCASVGEWTVWIHKLFVYCLNCLHPLYEWSARRRNHYLTTHNTHNRQTSMPPAGFEPPPQSQQAGGCKPTP